METVQLGSSGRTTTRLGFGCSSVMGILGRKQSLALLESAFDAGIRHFDTAPMYGYGEAEACLGDFLARHRGAVTVTSKFGVPAEAQSLKSRVVRGVARPVLQAFPGLKKRLQGGGVGSATLAAETQPEATQEVRPPNPLFTAAQAQASLESSLGKLRTERIDVWLLHDVTPVDLAGAHGEALLRMMEDAVAAGKVGTFGVGTDRREIPQLLAQHGAYCRVTQYEWSVLNPLVEDGVAFRIHHRALSGNFHALEALLQQDMARCRRWSEQTGADLAEAGTLARLMLKASYLLNPASVLLFSSKSAGHIVDNVANVGNGSNDSAARRLYEVFQRERGQLG